MANVSFTNALATGIYGSFRKKDDGSPRVPSTVDSSIDSDKLDFFMPEDCTVRPIKFKMLRDWRSSVPICISVVSILIALCALAGAVYKVSQLSQEVEDMKQNTATQVASYSSGNRADSSDSHVILEKDAQSPYNDTETRPGSADSLCNGVNTQIWNHTQGLTLFDKFQVLCLGQAPAATPDPNIVYLEQQVSTLRLTVQALQSQIEIVNETKRLLGSTYIHWGRRECTGDAETIYSGFGGGSPSLDKRMSGGGVQYLCLPHDPQWNRFDMSNDTLSYSWVYGAQYMSYRTQIFDDRIHGHNVVCAVCRAPRTAKVMIPAKRTCPRSWTREYEGYLMTSYVVNNRMTFECVDQDPQVVAGTVEEQGGALMYHVAGFCSGPGSLAHCPPYYHAKELTCVVCTR